MTRRELVVAFDVNERTVYKYEAAGMPVARRQGRGKPTLYDLEACLAWKAAHDAALEAAGNGGAPDLTAARIRKELATAALAEQRHAVRAGELVEVETARRVWGAQVAAIRTHVLSWPSTAIDRISRAAAKGDAELHRELDRMARELLTELADGAGDVGGAGPKKAAPKKKAPKKKAPKKKAPKKKAPKKKAPKKAAPKKKKKAK